MKLLDNLNIFIVNILHGDLNSHFWSTGILWAYNYSEYSLCTCGTVAKVGIAELRANLISHCMQT